MKKEGIIYILSNPYFLKGVVKIGKTTRSVEERAWEIYVGATGVPGEFKVEFKEFTFDCDVAEKRVHKRLEKTRINKYREFFYLNIDEVIKTIREEVKIVNSKAPKNRKKPVIKEIILNEDELLAKIELEAEKRKLEVTCPRSLYHL